MLQELRATGRDGNAPDGLPSYARLVSGVSGGSVTAAYFGLYGPVGLDRYRDTYPVKDAEQYMNTSAFNPVTIARGVSDGVNDHTTFARFLGESPSGEPPSPTWHAGPTVSPGSTPARSPASRHSCFRPKPSRAVFGPVETADFRSGRRLGRLPAGVQPNRAEIASGLRFPRP
jgi:hypothetical protein